MINKPIIVHLTMIDRTFLKEVPHLWVMHHDFNEPIKVGQEIVFMFQGEEYLKSKIVKVEEKGECADPKFEYFINSRKVWYGKKPVVKVSDWSNISPIARVHGVPNNWRGVVNARTKRIIERRKGK